MKFFTGDITKSGERLIAHGCNAQGRMGSGVALAIANKWPIVKQRYVEWFNRVDKQKNLLGQYSWVKADENTTVFNIITQEFYGRDGKKYACYYAIYEGLNDIAHYWGQQYLSAKFAKLAAYKDVSDDMFVIAVPKIGAGYGGLEWEFVKILLLELEEKHKNYQLEFHVYDV